MGKLTHTVKGPIASFRSADKAPIESLKLHFLPKQEGSGDPSPSNIRPITGWTGCNLTRCGVNCWDEQWEAGAWNPSTGEKLDTGASTIRSKNFIKVSSPGIYKSNTRILVLGYDENKQYLNAYSWTNQTTGIIHFSDPKIKYITFMTNTVYGSTYNNDILLTCFLNANYAQYSGETIPISWSDHGVEYGGYVDLATGEVWKTVNLLHFQPNYIQGVIQNSIGGNASYLASSATIGNAKGDQLIVCCDKLKSSNYQIFDDFSAYIPNEKRLVIGLPQELNTLEAVRNWMTDIGGFDLAYLISTPSVVASIEPHQLKSFLDYNNFWSDTNDDTEVEYCFADRLSERKLILDTPHIASVSGSIASFETDMKAPIVDLKAHFLPIQLGSGTPSVSNVRDIISIGSIGYFKNDKVQIPQLDSNEHYSSTTHIFEFPGSYGSNTTFSYDLNDDIIFENGKTYKIIVSVLAGFYTKLFGVAFKGDWPVSLVKTVETTGPTYLFGTDFTISGQSDILRDNKLNINIGKGSSELRFKVAIIEKTSNVFDDTTLSFANSYGNVYGGYIDLLSGELVDDVTAYETIWGDGTQAEILGNYERRVFIAETKIFKKAQEQADGGVYFCNVSGDFSPAMISTQWSADLPQYVFGNNAMILKLPVNTPSNTQIKFVGKRVEPITHQLTSQQMSALKGLNHFWSNVNGNIDVKYWTH